MTSGSTSHIDFAARLGVDALGNLDVSAPAPTDDLSRFRKKAYAGHS